MLENNLDRTSARCFHWKRVGDTARATTNDSKINQFSQLKVQEINY